MFSRHGSCQDGNCNVFYDIALEVILYHFSNVVYTSQPYSVCMCGTTDNWVAGSHLGDRLPHLESVDALKLYGKVFLFLRVAILSFNQSTQKGGKRLMN